MGPRPAHEEAGEFEAAAPFEGGEFPEHREEGPGPRAYGEFEEETAAVDEIHERFERAEPAERGEEPKGREAPEAGPPEADAEIEGAGADDEPDIIWENTAETARDTDMSDIPGRPGLKRRRGGRRR